ncbi:hypothetical protein Sjap_007618 [Stephania japonica]|uniref:Uncharacterized protein n=1 Tax=Stephania japonica TaxID=461633 RepID=A0AAP0JNB9_9MAGN
MQENTIAIGLRIAEYHHGQRNSQSVPKDGVILILFSSTAPTTQNLIKSYKKNVTMQQCNNVGLMASPKW